MKIQGLWDSAKAVLRGKSIPVHAYFKKEISQISNLSLHFKQLEKEVQTKFKAGSRRKKIIESRQNK